MTISNISIESLLREEAIGHVFHHSNLFLGALVQNVPTFLQGGTGVGGVHNTDNYGSPLTTGCKNQCTPRTRDKRGGGAFVDFFSVSVT